jgi:nuclear pore complex protein Nup98-Nup96
MQVAEKPLQNRALSMAVPRHLSQRRIKLLPRKYNTISDGKVMNDRTCKNRITSKFFL